MRVSAEHEDYVTERKRFRQPPTALRIWSSKFSLQHLTVKDNFVAGSIALSSAFAVMHPLDTIKTRIQASPSNTFRSFLKFSSFRSLFHGFTSSVLGAAPQGGIRLSTYELTKTWMNQSLGVDSALLCSATSAVCGDLASSVVKVPREVVTQRLQTGMHSSVPEAISCILKEQGVRGLFGGFVSTSLRDIPFMVILFSCYEEMRKRGIPAEGELTSLQSTVFGGMSGGLAGFLTTPIDVIKTRIMTSDVSSIRNAGKDIYRHIGVSGFFSGGASRSVWWFCVCSIFFPTYETLKSALAE